MFSLCIFERSRPKSLMLSQTLSLRRKNCLTWTIHNNRNMGFIIRVKRSRDAGQELLRSRTPSQREEKTEKGQRLWIFFSRKKQAHEKTAFVLTTDDMMTIRPYSEFSKSNYWSKEQNTDVLIYAVGYTGRPKRSDRDSHCSTRLPEDHNALVNQYTIIICK